MKIKLSGKERSSKLNNKKTEAPLIRHDKEDKINTGKDRDPEDKWIGLDEAG